MFHGKRSSQAVLCLSLLCVLTGTAASSRLGIISRVVNSDIAFEGVVSGRSYLGKIPLHITRILHGTVPDSNIVLNTNPIGFETGSVVLGTASWVRPYATVAQPEPHPVSMVGNLTKLMPDGSLLTCLDPDNLDCTRNPDSLDGRPMSDPGTYSRLASLLATEGVRIASNWLLSGTSVILVRITNVDKRAGTLGTEMIRTIIGPAIEHTPTVVRRPRTRIHGCAFVAVVGARLLLPVTQTSRDTLDAIACLERLVIDDQGNIPVFGLPFDSIDTVVSVTPTGLKLQPVVQRIPDH